MNSNTPFQQSCIAWKRIKAGRVSVIIQGFEISWYRFSEWNVLREKGGITKEKMWQTLTKQSFLSYYTVLETMKTWNEINKSSLSPSLITVSHLFQYKWLLRVSPSTSHYFGIMLLLILIIPAITLIESVKLSIQWCEWMKPLCLLDIDL